MSIGAFAPAQQPVAAIAATSPSKAPPKRTVTPLYDQTIIPEPR
ncbi:hypothetical protein [Sphingomonas sp. LHG3443-2]